MPTYITVTTTTNNIIVDFNDLENHPQVLRKRNWFPRTSVAYCTLLPSAEAILIYVDGGGEWRLDITGATGLPVTSINGTTITDNDHLFEQLSLM